VRQPFVTPLCTSCRLPRSHSTPTYQQRRIKEERRKEHEKRKKEKKKEKKKEETEEEKEKCIQKIDHKIDTQVALFESINLLIASQDVREPSKRSKGGCHRPGRRRHCRPIGSTVQSASTHPST
jgi:hypothetical protein